VVSLREKGPCKGILDHQTVGVTFKESPACRFVVDRSQLVLELVGPPAKELIAHLPSIAIQIQNDWNQTQWIIFWSPATINVDKSDDSDKMLRWPLEPKESFRRSENFDFARLFLEPAVVYEHKQDEKKPKTEYRERVIWPADQKTHAVPIPSEYGPG